MRLDSVIQHPLGVAPRRLDQPGVKPERGRHWIEAGVGDELLEIDAEELVGGENIRIRGVGELLRLSCRIGADPIDQFQVHLLFVRRVTNGVLGFARERPD